MQTQSLSINAARRREVRAAVHQNLGEREMIQADGPAESGKPKLSTVLFNLLKLQISVINLVVAQCCTHFNPARSPVIQSSSDEPSSHPDSPDIWPVRCYLELLHLS